MLNFIRTIGFYSIDCLFSVCKFINFTTEASRAIFILPFYLRMFCKQLLNIGYLSLPITALTAIFTGAVLALQSYASFAHFNAEAYIANIIVISITRELGPVLLALILAGRIGGATAAEIGAMKVTEQLDALRLLATNPIKYLVTTRLLAALLCFPLLAIITDVIGIYGGYLVSVYKLHLNPTLFINTTIRTLKMIDVVSGVVKATVFGFFIISSSCYCGYNCKKGAQGVGEAATRAMILSCIAILLANYLITLLFFYD